MIRLALKLALASAAVWALGTFVPIRGRTLAQRWEDAPSGAVFLGRVWAEVAGETPRPQARSPRSLARERPTEGHTEADRREVDRLLSERLAERK